jgi:hypothetical protein
MHVRDTLLALCTGGAAFVLGTVAGTELAATTIAFPVFVGLPVGVVAGVASAAVTYRWLSATAPARRRRGAALAAFGVAFVALLPALVVVGNRPTSEALAVATVGGAVAAVATAAWLRRAEGAVAPAARS